LLSFQQILLRKFLLGFSLLFLALGLVFYIWIKDFYLSQTKNALINNLKILSLTIKEGENFDSLADEIKKNLGIRLTVISADGKVLAESHNDKAIMENHRYRDEIIEADSQKYATKIRYSHTLKKDLLYVATKVELQNKHTIYLRLAKRLTSIDEHIFMLGAEITGLLFLFLCAVFIITYRISRELDYEVQKIGHFVKSLTKKEKSTYVTSNFSIEFYNITNLLTKVAQILVKKEKQKSKFTDKLKLSNRQKDDIISAISHEFKNPIAVINGYSQTLMDDADINTNIRQKFLTKIYKNGIKLSELIDTLRLSSKLDSGKQELQFKDIELNELVKETVENLSSNYPKRDVIIETKKSVSIRGDASLLGVVITNLVENAFKYSEDEVHIRFDKNSLSIIDTGIGISKKDLENITNKFYRVNENSWNNSLGLGLFIVNNILTLHKFKLKIESKEKEGSIFKVEF
jgi:signal transduction histidine kinase